MAGGCAKAQILLVRRKASALLVRIATLRVVYSICRSQKLRKGTKALKSATGGAAVATCPCTADDTRKDLHSMQDASAAPTVIGPNANPIAQQAHSMYQAPALYFFNRQHPSPPQQPFARLKGVYITREQQKLVSYLSPELGKKGPKRAQDMRDAPHRSSGDVSAVRARNGRGSLVS